MNDFKSYRPDGRGTDQGGKNDGRGDSPQAGAGGAAGGNAELAALIAKAFAGKSEGQMLSAIISQAEQSKRDGTLTNTDLDNFYNVVSPMLDGFRRKKLQQIIARLKRI